MDNDAPSLQDLREIVVPESPSPWPFAPGVWIAIAVVALLAALCGWILWDHRRRNAYRRAGLTLLDDARSGHDISVLLKRVALATYPREEVASLFGPDWLEFLTSSCPRHDVSSLAKLDPQQQPSPESVALARTWITHHQAPSS